MEETMIRKKWLAMLIVAMLVVPLVLSACGATPEPETIIQEVTSVVRETVVVEGEAVEVTRVVTEEKEVVITATPEPEPTEPPKAVLEGLWYRVVSEPPTLDIQVAQDTTSHLIIDNCIEGLMTYDKDGNIVPAGATGYDVSDDGLVYTATLRENAVWSDGVPVIAQHFVDGFVRLMDPETAANYAWMMYAVENAEEFNTGEIDDPSLMGIAAPDDYTVVYTLKQPTSYFAAILAFATTMPVRMDVVEAHPDDWTEAGNYVSNGPYVLESWEHEREVVLVKNPTYWNADAVRIEKVTIPIIAEDATALALYENDELHVTGYPSEDLPRIQEDPLLSTELRQTPRPGVYYIGLNTTRAPTDNMLVRKALASAIDRRSYLDNVTHETWRTEATSTTPPGILGFQGKEAGYDFDPEQAAAWMEEAGWCLEEGAEYRSDCETGEIFPTLQMYFNRADYNYDVIEAVASMWEEYLNIPTGLNVQEWGVYIDYLDACEDSVESMALCEYNTYRMGWVMDYGDAQNQLEIVFGIDSPFNYTGTVWTGGEYRDRFNELLELANAETDNDARAALYKEADQILVQDWISHIPLHYYDRSIMIKSGLYFEYPAFGAPHFDLWYFED
jgi:oligopeptide transport system substrate-binding protein